tara:strand:- start:160 stop:843 length:684 start_codon:yes stop_codon:yes gene_type:complete
MTSLSHIILLSPKDRTINLEHLKEDGLTFDVSDDPNLLDISIENGLLTLVIIELGAFWAYQSKAIIQKCSDHEIPVFGILPEEFEPDLASSINLSDFILRPFTEHEFNLRLQRLISNQYSKNNVSRSNTINMGSMKIDLDSYEVTIYGDRVLLTYKEFQLLCLMANTPGRVYSREALLSSVWGYDYFGGTRTVDVHIRRLRSKIESSDSIFIETIRNVGYRFNQRFK